MTVTAFARMPPTISIGATVSYVDSVIVTPSESDVSARKSLRGIRRQYMCSVNPNDSEEVQNIIMAHEGRRYPFGMRDWLAYRIVDEVLVSESTTIFKFQKVWQPSSGGRTAVERILILDETDVDVVVKVNGATVTNWDFIDFGKIEFDAPLDPDTDEVTSSAEYLKAVVMADNASATLNETFSTFGDLRMNEISEAELTQLLLT